MEIHVLIYVQQDATLHSLFYLETALHVSGGTTTHYQGANNCIYSIWYLSHRYCYLPVAAGSSVPFSIFTITVVTIQNLTTLH